LQYISVLDILIMEGTEMSEETITLKEHFEDKFSGLKEQVDVRFSGIEKNTAITFAASEKAIDKAEEAQKDKNVLMNEFRGQLSDQAATLMPRKEVEGMVDALRDRVDYKFESREKEVNAKLKEVDKRQDEERKRGDLGEGKSTATSKYTATILVIISVLIGLISLLVKFLF
jgi:hypothetical protein